MGLHRTKVTPAGLAALALLMLLGLTGAACTSPAEPLGEPDLDQGEQDRYVLLQPGHTFFHFGLNADRLGESYRVVEGACGVIVFTEKVGVDFDSAFSVIEQRKTEQMRQWCPDAPCFDIRLEPKELKVVDEYQIAPEPGFYMLLVIDKATGYSVHSPSEVITTEGDLFTLEWCPD